MGAARDPDRPRGRAHRRRGAGRGRAPRWSWPRIRARRWPTPRRCGSARSPRRWSRSPAPTARPRVATFTRQIWEALGLRRRSTSAPPGVEGAWSRAAGAHHARADHPAPRAGRGGRGRASPTRRWRPRPTGSTSGGSTGCGCARRPSPTSRQDHLDYHADFEAYFAAKAGLFDRVLPEDGMAVVNLDDPRGADDGRASPHDARAGGADRGPRPRARRCASSASASTPPGRTCASPGTARPGRCGWT